MHNPEDFDNDRHWYPSRGISFRDDADSWGEKIHIFTPKPIRSHNKSGRKIMHTTKGPLNSNNPKAYPFPRLLTHLLPVFIIGCLCFSGCTVMKEAQQRREERLKKQRDDQYLMLAAAKGDIQFGEGARTAESAHYTITFAEDLLNEDENFDEISERRVYADSALSYMESLYNEMNAVFGFQPEHKIHVTLHKIYRGTTSVATTTTQYNYRRQGNTTLKSVTGIKMDFPIPMYEKPTTRVHELTHAFTNIYFLPTWFNEGIAVLMETEWGKAGLHKKFDSLETYLKRNMDGINDLEDWATHGGSSQIIQWRYRYAYTIVSELRKRYGPDFYIKVFRLMDADQLHNKLPSKMSTSFLVYYLSQAAGTDLTPFFTDLAFKVQKLTKAQILENIQQMNR